jgi:hypothetical protein
MFVDATIYPHPAQQLKKKESEGDIQKFVQRHYYFFYTHTKLYRGKLFKIIV